MGALAIVFVALGFLIDEASAGAKPGLELIELAIFSAITATATSYLISTGRPHDESRGGHLVEEMERVAALREQGSLSDEEFTEAKHRLLR